MKWAEFYHRTPDGRYRPALGSDGVYVFDGRLGLQRQHAEAVSHGRKRGYAAYSLHYGPRFTAGAPARGVPGLITIPAETTDKREERTP